MIPVPAIEEDNLSGYGFISAPAPSTVWLGIAEEDDEVEDWLGRDEPTVVLDTGMFSVKVSKWGR